MAESKKKEKTNSFPDPGDCPYYKLDNDEKDLWLTLRRSGSVPDFFDEEEINNICEKQNCKFCKNYEPVIRVEKIELGSRIFFSCAKKT